LRHFIFYFLCAIIIYAPLPLGANRIWASSSIEILIFSAFLLHLFLAFRNRKSLRPPPYSYAVLVPLGLIVLWLIVQILPDFGFGFGVKNSLSFDPSLTHIMLLKTLAFTLFAWLIFCYVKSRQRLYQLSLAIIFSGLFQASYAAWLNLNVGMVTPVFGMEYAERANGSFIYANQLANYLALCLSIGIGILVSQLSRVGSADKLRHKIRDAASLILSQKMVIRLGLIIMVIALILTRSRMGNSAFFIALAISSLFAFFYYRNKPPKLRVLIISFFIIDLILIGSIFGVEKVKERLAETQSCC